MWLIGAPCNRSSGGPSPPVTRLIVAPDVWTFMALKPAGKNLVVSVGPCSNGVAALAAVLATSIAVDCCRKFRRFMAPPISRQYYDMPQILLKCIGGLRLPRHKIGPRNKIHWEWL